MTLVGRLLALGFWSIVVGAAAAVFSMPASAAAPPADPAIAVYVEQIPTGSGSVAPGTPSAPPPQTPTKPDEKLQQEGGDEAGALDDLVNSPDLGAPTPATEPSPRPAKTAAPSPGPAKTGAPSLGPSKTAAPSAAPSPVATSSDGTGTGLGLAALVGILALMTVAALVARRVLRARRGSLGSPPT